MRRGVAAGDGASRGDAARFGGGGACSGAAAGTISGAKGEPATCFESRSRAPETLQHWAQARKVRRAALSSAKALDAGSTQTMARTVALIAALAAAASAFVAPGAAAPRLSPRRAGDDVMEAGSSATTKRIQSMVDDNTVMLFMKGTKIFPQCGFSNMAVQILNAIGQDFETFDCLSDENVRSTIKEFSDWPTIPQLYVDGEFVGGSDIMLEMYEAGELQEMIEVAAAS